MSIAVHHNMHGGLPDWVSPFFTKELRQGLRSRVFVWAYSWLALTLSIITGLRLFAAQTAGAESLSFQLDTLLWWNVTGLLHYIIPFRKVISGDEDLQPEHRDLLMLTPGCLDGLLFGKWLTGMAMICLSVVLVAPYFLVRYFLGGVDIVLEMGSLAGLVCAGCLHTLAGMFVSSFQVLGRIIWMLLSVPCVLIVNSVTLLGVLALRHGSGETTSALSLVFIVYFLSALMLLAFVSSRFGSVTASRYALLPRDS